MGAAAVVAPRGFERMTRDFDACAALMLAACAQAHPPMTQTATLAVLPPFPCMLFVGSSKSGERAEGCDSPAVLGTLVVPKRRPLLKLYSNTTIDMVVLGTVFPLAFRPCARATPSPRPSRSAVAVDLADSCLYPPSICIPGIPRVSRGVARPVAAANRRPRNAHIASVEQPEIVEEEVTGELVTEAESRHQLERLFQLSPEESEASQPVAFERLLADVEELGREADIVESETLHMPNFQEEVDELTKSLEALSSVGKAPKRERGKARAKKRRALLVVFILSCRTSVGFLVHVLNRMRVPPLSCCFARGLHPRPIGGVPVLRSYL